MPNDVSCEVERWSKLQTAYWRVGSSAPLNFHDEWARLNDTVVSIFLIDIQNGVATIQSKPKFFSDRQIAEASCVHTERISLYRSFLDEVIGQNRIRSPLRLAIDVSDFPLDSFIAPVLAFQKQRGSPNVLLPDVDFFYHGWYDNLADPVPGGEKQSRITFVGASTGGIVTETVVLDKSLPRLALAAALVEHPRIDFRIGAAVQCTHEARALLEAQPYFSGALPWESQLRARFILSVDGNGATCSRVVKTLMSNSVLLKYTSDAMLYYFDGLVPGEHYLPVASVEDLDRILALDDAGHLDPMAISKAAQAFHRHYLTRDMVTAYTASVLRRLAEIVHGPERRRFWSYRRTG